MNNLHLKKKDGDRQNQSQNLHSFSSVTVKAELLHNSQTDRTSNTGLKTGLMALKSEARGFI